MLATTEAHVYKIFSDKTIKLFQFQDSSGFETPWLIHKKKPLPLHLLFWQLSPYQEYHTALRCVLGDQCLGNTSC